MPLAFNISYTNTPIGAQTAKIATGSNRGDTIGDKFGDLRIWTAPVAPLQYRR
jgi:hypothetical protein